MARKRTRAGGSGQRREPKPERGNGGERPRRVAEAAATGRTGRLPLNRVAAAPPASPAPMAHSLDQEARTKRDGRKDAAAQTGRCSHPAAGRPSPPRRAGRDCTRRASRARFRLDTPLGAVPPAAGAGRGPRGTGNRPALGTEAGALCSMDEPGPGRAGPGRKPGPDPDEDPDQNLGQTLGRDPG